MVESKFKASQGVAIACALLTLALAFIPSSARAEAPWWHLTSGTRPTYLKVTGMAKPGQPAIPGQDEVQTITVAAAPGESWAVANMNKEEVEKEEIECHTTPPQPKFAIFSVGAPASLVQSGLEEICGYGPGSVEVTGIPAGEPAEYVVKFKGPLAEQPVRLLNTEVGALAGFAGTETVTELTQGKAGIPEVPPAADGELYVTAENVGDANVEGTKTPVRIRDVLPAGLKAVGVAGTKPQKEGDFHTRELLPCSLKEEGGSQVASCTLTEGLAPYDQIEMRVSVNVEAGAHTGELNEVSLSGGGASSASLSRAITISTAPVPFGVEQYEMAAEEEGGTVSRQAGSHPFQLNTTIALNQLKDINPLEQPPNFKPEVTPPALTKDLNVKLPSGLIGNPTAIPQCTTAQFFETVNSLENKCPAASAVGVAVATVHEPSTVGTSTLTEPVFNLEPLPGEPARFGFYVVIASAPVFIDTSVRAGGDYGVTVNVNNITQTAAFLSSEVTFWGVPGDPRHDKQRGWGCLYEARNVTPHAPCTTSSQTHPPPFLSLPTSCKPTLQTSVEGDPWSAPGEFFDFPGVFEPAGPLTGCNRLAFEPQLLAESEKHEASKPSGMTIDVHVPQEANESASGIASSNIKSTTVVFPPGVSVNPSAADGLQACSEGEIGYLNARGAEEELLFSSTLPEAFCPNGAKIGSVKIKSPLLANPLEGGLYLATPAPNGEGGKNPFDSLVAVYIVARDPVSGVFVKLPGRISLDSGSGQISSTFENTPDLSAEDIEINLFGGPRAPLATPAGCGTYPVSATFTPWSETPPVTSIASFSVTSGPGGGACPGSRPFSPSLTAGLTNGNAGAFGNLSTTINREDGEGQIKSVSLHTPEGLSGVLTGVALCANEQADAGTCPQSSEIGESTVGAGFGADPFTVKGGKVYLTGPYNGAGQCIVGSPGCAPFGLSIVTPAIAGPFNLGNVIVRAKIEVDPHNATLTATTNESGPYAIPRILDGIPLSIRHVNVAINRQNFTFNPTSCNKTSVGATIVSYEGASASPQSAFQAANCQNLKFAPSFSVSSGGRTSRMDGASLVFRISYPRGAMGSESWFREAKFDIPRQLPARLTTIQKACVAATFEHDRSACPAHSVIGHAVVHTQLLPVPLEGPVYFVSYGGAAFPDAVLVLDGYGVHIELHGNTFIKNGVTSATFADTPDVPFESIEVSVPAGPFSEFAANLPAKAKGSLCGQKLVMPVLFKAQNGREIHQNTPIAITGCPRHKKATRAHLLAKALKACKRKPKSKRAACARAAHRKYGARRKTR